jgi:hypothetical protein
MADRSSKSGGRSIDLADVGIQGRKHQAKSLGFVRIGVRKGLRRQGLSILTPNSNRAENGRNDNREMGLSE